MRRWQLTICLASLIPVLSGCAENPITGRSQLKIVSEDSAINLSKRAYSSLIGDLRDDGKIIVASPTKTRIQRITDRVVSQAITYRPDTAGWDWQVELIDDPKIVNAFCAPGGRMAVYSGLVLKVDPTDDELAQVMGHEISHALLGHGAEKMSMGILSSAIVAGVAATGQTYNQQQNRQMTADLATELLMNLPNSRTSEAEADSVGIEIAAKAGFNPDAAATLWEKMISYGGASKSRIDFLGTHPAPVKRIEALRKRADTVRPLYLAATNAGSRQGIAGAPSNTAPYDSTSTTRELSLAEMCAFSTGIDRLECLGTISLGMSRPDAIRAIGTEGETMSGARVIRYQDRYLEFDARDRLVGITDQPPP